VKNIRYYGSQPWAFADNLLAGSVCEIDGSDEIRMDEEELSCACWISREEIPVEYTDSSLTNEMICAFKNRKY
jgi:NAD+ diphosphatase